MSARSLPRREVREWRSRTRWRALRTRSLFLDDRADLPLRLCGPSLHFDVGAASTSVSLGTMLGGQDDSVGSTVGCRPPGATSHRPCRRQTHTRVKSMGHRLVVHLPGQKRPVPPCRGRAQGLAPAWLSKQTRLSWEGAGEPKRAWGSGGTCCDPA